MIEVKFNTTFQGLKETAPIQPAMTFMPEWFKKMPAQYMKKIMTPDIGKGAPLSSTRLCPGLVEYFKKGFIVPLWSDLLIDVSRKGKEVKWFWKFADDEYKLDVHSPEQFLNYVPGHAQKTIHMVFKVISPWTVQLPKGYSMYQLPVYYQFDPNFHVLPGIFPGDTYSELHSQLCVTTLDQFIIKRGTPIAHYVPFKREDFKHKILYNDKEMNDFHAISGRKVNSNFKKRWRSAQKIPNF